MSVNEDTEHVPCRVKLVLLKIMSAPLVPTVPDRTVASAPSMILKAVAVPAAVSVSLVIALAVAVPPEAAPKAVPLRAREARTEPKELGVPVPIWSLPAPPVLMSAVTAFTAAFLAAADKVTAIIFLP